jgi:hypothetical protein
MSNMSFGNPAQNPYGAAPAGAPIDPNAAAAAAPAAPAGGMAMGAMGMMSSMSNSNTLPIALNSGLAASKLAKPMIDAAKAEGFQKLPMDQFVSAAKAQTAANVPIADALQQQSFIARFAGKLPLIKNFMGPDFLVNNAIGSLGRKGLGTASAVDVTRIAYEGGPDVAKKLAAAGVPADAVKSISEAAGQREAALGEAVVKQAAKTGTQDVTEKAAQAAAATTGSQLTVESVAGVVKDIPNGGLMANKVMPSVEEIQKAVSGSDAVGGLRALGFRQSAARAIAKSAGASLESGAKTAATTAGKEAATKGGIFGRLFSKASGSSHSGFFGKLFSGMKGNFVIAGIFSIGSNAISLATGKMNFKQFIALSAMDTGAYGLIGLGSAAAGGALAGVIGQALVPIPGLGFILGMGLGLLGGMIYSKVIRKPVQDMLGPVGGSAPAGAPDPSAQPQQPAVGPGQYQDPYAQQAPQAQQQAPQQQAPQTPAGVGAPAAGMSYDQAQAYLNSVAGTP